MNKKVSKLRKAWNIIRGRHPMTNADGTITTKYGHRIVPYKVTTDRQGNRTVNISAFLAQPRMGYFMKSMKPLLSSPHGDKIISDMSTGEFFLESDLKKHGRAGVTVLGQFDPELEEDLVKQAVQLTATHKMFGDASPDNPIVIEADGTVYPKNNPSDVRGKVKLGGAVNNTSRRKHKPR